MNSELEKIKTEVLLIELIRRQYEEMNVLSEEQKKTEDKIEELRKFINEL